MTGGQVEHLRQEVERLLAAALRADQAHAAELRERDSRHSAELRRRDATHTTEMHQRDDAHEVELHDRDESHMDELRRRNAVHDADTARRAAAHAGEVAERDAAWDVEREQFQRALESRDVIGQAKGIVMASLGCTADEAYDLLVKQSQSENRKVVDIARELAARAQRTLTQNRPATR